MILEESSSKGPHTGKDKVDLIKFSGRVRRGVLLCQQTVQQGAQRLEAKRRNWLSHFLHDKELHHLFKNHWREGFWHSCVLTCTMLFSGMGVMVFRLQRTCSRQYGTYLSNRIVRLARSDWACLVSIQLVTYLGKQKETTVSGSERNLWF